MDTDDVVPGDPGPSGSRPAGPVARDLVERLDFTVARADAELRECVPTVARLLHCSVHHLCTLTIFFCWQGALGRL